VHALRLPTPTGKFYSDFVAKLKDGRYLVVEYKGKDWKDNIDSTEKKDHR
jgi:type III restriction enzyme